MAGVEVRRVWLGGMPCDLLTRAAATALVREALAGTGPGPVLLASANLDRLNRFGAGRSEEGFFEEARHADRWLVLLDGAPLVAQARRLTGQSWPRLAGSDLLPELLDLTATTGSRVGFLGGRAGTHERLRETMRVRWPGVAVAGAWSPSPEDVEYRSAELAAAVRDARTDLLVLALTPRGERWLDEWAEPCGVRVAADFGAAAEFLVGERHRAPVAVQRAGLEWAWRLAHEPRRLARRYLVEGPQAYWRLRRQSRLA